MTTTTMHFGPEWMRTKGSTRPAPSPPLTTSPAPPGASTYSALVTPVTPSAPERRDIVHPFRYSREEMLRIYKEGGGRGGLGLEVERWEGIVREVGYDPVGLKEMSEGEKKIFAGSLNSEIRRRQSTDVLSPLTTSLGDRPKLGHTPSGLVSPMRERIGNIMGRRRDSTDQAPLSLPRKLSLSSVQGPLASPRDAALPSPRARMGLAPGFDGVLSESWSSRRRPSESTSKPGVDVTGRREREPSDSGSEVKRSEIKEEDTTSVSEQLPDNTGSGTGTSSERDPLPTNSMNGSLENSAQASADNLIGGVASLGIGRDSPNVTPAAHGTDRSMDIAATRPPGLTDLASIEWSYLDPQGQIQGPFRADIMQRWHDEGYFSADLLMKRTHLDSEWTSVGEMSRRAGGKPIFLTLGVTSVAPPGLTRRLDPLLEGPLQAPDRNSPFQPVPTPSLRTSALDSYLQNGSSASASPSSSTGAAGFVNGSPEPSAFEARTSNHIFTDSPVGPRLGPFSTTPGSPITVAGQRRTGFNESFESAAGLRPSFPHTPTSRMEGLGFNGLDGTTTSSIDSGVAYSSTAGSLHSRQDFSMSNGRAGSSNFTGVETGAAAGINGQPNVSRVMNRDVFSRSTGDDMHSPFMLGGSFVNGSASFPSNGQHFPQNQPLSYPSQDGRSFNSLNPVAERQPTLSHPISNNQQLRPSFSSNASFSGSQSQWPLQGASAPRRPGPFDPDYPTVNNTVITGSTTTPHRAFIHTSQSPSSNEQSPWFTAPTQGAAGDGWAGNSSSLTVANLGHHNQQQQQEDSQSNPIEVADTSVHAAAFEESLPNPPDPVESAAVRATAEQLRPVEKSRRKSSVQPASSTIQPVVNKVPVPTMVAKPPSPVTPVEPKPAWAKEEESKTAKPAGATLGLREIQEAEMRKLEARKAAERERERAARAANGSASQAEDFQPFTASWGLPTSQAGTARATSTAKDSAPSLATPTTPVWTSTPKTPVTKKSMKEIQEEEEKRKKLAAKEKETVAAAAKRGYAETTNKSTPPAQTLGGAWTTVGTGGKAPSATTSTTTTRAVVSTSNSVKTGASVSSTAAMSPSATNVRVTTTSAAVTSRPPMSSKATSKVDDFPTPPSHEFLKWLGDSLKGLNNSINFEEITSMLLSFPLDPDPSTVEIISDLIYASSTTLDGRRFASEYVNRRKADAASRSKNGAPASSSAKPLSIAEVVKTQPKPAQSEWGFKVVNKKKKGGRA